MVKRKNLPVVLIILGAGLFLAFRTLGLGGGNNPPATKYDKILHTVGEMLAERITVLKRSMIISQRDL